MPPTHTPDTYLEDLARLVRRSPIWLGWLAWGCISLSVVLARLDLELADREWAVLWARLVFFLFLFVPLGAYLQFAGRWPLLVRRVVRVLGALAALPWLLTGCLGCVLMDEAPQSVPETLFRSRTRPEVRIERRRVNEDEPGLVSYQVVQLTPTLGWWQLVEPVDTAALDFAHWQRVSR
ncbi:hypothetical protein [Hymenobacter sp. B81]|uniref:hypothetical protein n=1 Tax=Hymenobacter sp. B81 TaxID=3344878 RepID=UPI0037DD314A